MYIHIIQTESASLLKHETTKIKRGYLNRHDEDVRNGAAADTSDTTVPTERGSNKMNWFWREPTQRNAPRAYKPNHKIQVQRKLP